MAAWRLAKLGLRKFNAIALILFAVFLLSGGLGAVQSYKDGAKTYGEYRMSTLAPLFGGGVMIGAFGLLYAVQNRNSRYCLVGFFIVGFCYFFMEYLFQAVGAI